jgi:ribosomal protein L37AE/L43A
MDMQELKTRTMQEPTEVLFYCAECRFPVLWLEILQKRYKGLWHCQRCGHIFVKLPRENEPHAGNE